jgi:hypothetical protein
MRKTTIAASAITALHCFLLPAAQAGEGLVSWADPTCGYFILKLPDGDPKDAFGLFSVKAPPVPKVDDVIAGEVETAQEPTLENRTASVSHNVIHWANARELAMLVRNTPVQCASRWKKKK